MAVTLTSEQLAAAIRVGTTDEETAMVTRLLAYATQAVSRHLADEYDNAPEAVVNEATIRLAAYLYDLPHVTGPHSPLRNSGAASILEPYRQHRAGLTRA
ncbi:MAG: hypothetical protein OXM88_12840 [bacterium]|nr:hypothetical protein [bacterium]